MACVFVLQVAAGQVLVQRLDGSAPAVMVSTKLQLAGVDVTNGALLLHDGCRAEVLRFNDAAGSIVLAAEFEVPGLPTQQAPSGGGASAEGRAARGVVVGAGDGRVAMALHGDVLFRTAEGRAEICSWAGVVRQPLPFDEAQGQPLLLDVSSRYLAVLTSKAVVRVFKLTGAEAKPHAGPGECSAAHLQESLTRLVDMLPDFCNADVAARGCSSCDALLVCVCCRSYCGAQDLRQPAAGCHQGQLRRFHGVRTGQLARQRRLPGPSPVCLLSRPQRAACAGPVLRHDGATGSRMGPV